MKILRDTWLKKWLPRYLILFLIFFFAKSLMLNGGERKGLCFSLSIGCGITKYSENLQFWSSPESYETIIKGGGSIGGRFGYAPNDQLMFVLLSASNIFAKKAYSETVFIEEMVNGLGICYYLKETHPSVFFEAGIGLGDWMSIIHPHDGIHGYSELYSGFGGIIGIGYEFAHRWSLENRIFYNHLSFTRDNVDGTANTLSYSITFSYSLYGLWRKKDKDSN
jgi:hypothetical protein